MTMQHESKMSRQLRLYMHICSTHYHGPSELMEQFGMGRRTLQRDLKDLRDSGVIRLSYMKSEDNYVEADDAAVFDETAVGRRRQHLIRLKRLVTLIDRLPRTDMDALNRYESECDEYAFYQEYMVKEPERFPPEGLDDPPELPVFEDIKSAYYALFPESNERMRQRDFKELRDIGFSISYSRKYKVFIFKDDHYFDTGQT